jgi:hypothetical protein
MIKLDDNLLAELGLASLPPEEKKKMLAHIYETLEMRVGMELAKQMSDTQLSEFEQFINRNDEAGALHWLESNFPNYKNVVAAEFEKLKAEIRQLAPQILVGAGVAGGQPQPQPMAMPQQPQQQPQPQPYSHPQQPQQYPQPPMPPQYDGGQPQHQQPPMPQQPQYPQQQPMAPQHPQQPYQQYPQQAQYPQQPPQQPPYQQY